MPALKSIEEVMPLARMIATREAHREDDVDDLVQVALFAYHRATEQQSRSRVDSPAAFAGTVMQRAMRGYYWRTREWQGRGQPQLHEPIDALNLPLDGPTAPQRHDPDMVLVDFFQAIDAALGPVSRAMAENLISPHGACARRLLDEVRGKQAARKGRKGTHLPRGVTKQVRISARMVRDALNIPAAVWVVRMQELRDFTKLWLAIEQ